MINSFVRFIDSKDREGSWASMREKKIAEVIDPSFNVFRILESSEMKELEEQERKMESSSRLSKERRLLQRGSE